MATWTDQDLTILLGLFYGLAFREGDANHETNGKLSRALDRTRAAVDFQWRNICNAIRPTPVKRNIAKSIRVLVAKYRDSPTTAVVAAKHAAAARAASLMPLFEPLRKLDARDFSDTAQPSLGYDADAVLTQLVWVRPHLALSASTEHLALVSWLAERLQFPMDATRNRLRTLFAILNSVQLDHPALQATYKELAARFPDLLRHENFQDTLTRATEACMRNHWCVDTLIH